MAATAQVIEKPHEVLGTPKLSGHLHLEADARDDGRTFLSYQSFRAPFHLSKPYWTGRSLMVQVINPTAGILAGDDLEMRIRVRRDAALAMTTPAATRAFMMQNGVARCRQHLSVDAGGFLEYTPEPLCPHRETDFTQRTVIECGTGAELYFVDSVAPGRVGRGERWAWRRLRLALELRIDGEPALVEHLDHTGERMARAAEFYGTPEAWMATVLVFSHHISEQDTIWGRIAALHDGSRMMGVSRLRPGFWVIRLLAGNGQELQDSLKTVRALVAERLAPLQSDLRKL